MIADFYVDVLGFEIESPDRDDQYEVVVRDGSGSAAAATRTRR